jgi:hypothetical protein
LILLEHDHAGRLVQPHFLLVLKEEIPRGVEDLIAPLLRRPAAAADALAPPGGVAGFTSSLNANRTRGACLSRKRTPYPLGRYASETATSTAFTAQSQRLPVLSKRPARVN